MPFTLSHAVLAPYISKISGQRLPIAPLAIGCMIPDLYRLFVRGGDVDPYLAHYWSSLFYPDLFLGVAFSFLWYVLYRPVIYTFIGLEDDINLHNVKAFIKFCISICIAIIIGVCTHIIWDGLTHADFRTIFFKNILEKNIKIWGSSFELHMVLQIITSIVTLPLLIWIIFRYYQMYKIKNKINRRVMFSGWGLVLLSIVIGLFSVRDYLRSLPQYYVESHLYNIVGISFNEFTQSTLFVFTLGCILLQIINTYYDKRAC